MSTQSTGLRTEQTQRMRMTQKQRLFVRLTEMNSQEFDEAVRNQLQENPALEEEEYPHEEPVVAQRDHSEPIHYPTMSWQGESRTREMVPEDTTETLNDSLKLQVSERKIPDDVEKAAMYLIANIDRNGYLRIPLRGIQEEMVLYHDMNVSTEVLEAALSIIKTLDPPGVGAFDLQECLLLQLQRMPRTQTVEDAIKIIEKKFNAFANKHYHKLISGLRIKEERVEKAMDLIKSLNPRPGNTFSAGEVAMNVIIPDFIVTRDENTGDMMVGLHNKLPELRIAESFDQAYRSLQSNRRGKKVKGNEYTVYNYREAKDFIDVVRQRQQTLFTVMSAIVTIQREYFETEDIYRLKPMMIKDIEKLTGLDKSTISRVTNRKYVQLPWGVFPLRFFFSDSIGKEKDSKALTNRKIEEEIRQIVAAEDKRQPLSDEKIRLAMEERGYSISRRTVAKYRERCNIPVARLRK